MIPRFFLQSAVVLAAVFAVIGNPSRTAATDSGKPQYYELRVYTTQSEAQQKRVNDYWQNAAVPAYNRMGIQPVGVFTEMQDSATNKIYVLIPCDSLETFAAIPAKLGADAAYQQAAGEFLTAPKSNPAYEHFESSLLVAFDGMKHIAVPPPEKKPNVFELRTYLSPGESKGYHHAGCHRGHRGQEATLHRPLRLVQHLCLHAFSFTRASYWGLRRQSPQ